MKSIRKTLLVLSVLTFLLTGGCSSQNIENTFVTEDKEEQLTYAETVSNTVYSPSSQEDTAETESVSDPDPVSESESVAEPEPVPEPEPFPEYDITLMAVGDNLMHMGVVYTGKQTDGSFDYSCLYEGISEFLENADIKIINQETILGGNERGFSGYPYFNSAYSAPTGN